MSMNNGPLLIQYCRQIAVIKYIFQKFSVISTIFSKMFININLIRNILRVPYYFNNLLLMLSVEIKRIIGNWI
jgi:hypothetical protein